MNGVKVGEAVILSSRVKRLSRTLGLAMVRVVKDTISLIFNGDEPAERSLIKKNYFFI